MSIFGTAIPVSLFGESHEKIIGITVHNMVGNFVIDCDLIKADLEQRKANKWYHTSRQEPDEFEIISGYFNGKTTGAPLTIIIKNKHMNSEDYTPGHVRPNHADYPAYIRSDGAYDYRGGGHFSGRLTALLVILGSLSKQLLARKNIIVASHIKQLHNVHATPLNLMSVSTAKLLAMRTQEWPVFDQTLIPKFEQLLTETLAQKDSVGGVVQTVITNLEVGLGDPFFDGIDALISHLIMALPSTKGIQFGDGFSLANKTGEAVTDTVQYEQNKVVFKANHMGGVLGGLSTGNMIVFDTVIKPTPSIKKPVKTINLVTQSNCLQSLKGRHDPCIVPRIVPVINAVSYYALLELIVRKDGWSWIK